MKKSVISLCLAVILCFFTAVTLCIQALNGSVPVASFAQGGINIVLDAGHGGIDGGVSGRTSKVKESDLNLNITLCLKEKLEEIGFDVTLTRKTEAGLYDVATKGFKRRDMQKRKEIIEKAKPAFVISIHQNYYPSQSTRGAQVFYNKKNEKSEKLAIALQTQLNEVYKSEGVKNRKHTAGEYFMLDCTSYPSVIVECGFLSSSKDEKLLVSKSWQNKLCEGMATAVMTYLSDFTA